MSEGDTLYTIQSFDLAGGELKWNGLVLSKLVNFAQTKFGLYNPLKIMSSTSLPTTTPHAKCPSSFVPSAITRSFFELQTPDFAWKFVWTVPTNYEKKNCKKKNKIKKELKVWTPYFALVFVFFVESLYII